MKNQVNIINRKIKPINGNKNVSELFQDNISTLANELITVDKIVILSEPGMGKTTELYYTAKQIWAEKEELGYVPIFIDLKKYHEKEKFEDLIKYKEWKKLPGIIFFLDGLDEIAKPRIFIQELIKFIDNNQSNRAKFILSIRSNFYDKLKSELIDFTNYQLLDLSYNEIIEFLNLSEYNLNENEIDEIIKNRNNSNDIFYRIPFFLSNLIYFFKEKNDFPKNKGELWKFIVKRLIEKQKIHNPSVDIDESLLKAQLSKLSLYLELTNRNDFNGDENLEIGNNNELILNNNPFIYLDTDKYYFEHKQFQEYFSALEFSKKPMEKIIEIIRIEKTNMICSDLLNTVSILLDISTDQKYEDLKDWFLNNDYKVLFHVESSRLREELRNELFEKYFNEVCIENSFWINHNNNIGVQLLSKFASLDYLLSIVQNNEYIDRTIMSAFNILSYFDLTKSDYGPLKLFLLSQLKTNNLSREKNGISDYRIKSEIIDVINNQRLYEDSEYLKEIFEIFQGSSNRDLNAALIRLINKLENIDDYFWFVKQEVEYLYCLKNREIPDDIHYGTTYTIENITGKLQEENNFLDALKMIYNNQYGDSFTRINAPNNIEERIKDFSNKNENFIYRLIDVFLPTTNYFYINEKLLEFIKMLDKKDEAFKYIFKNFNFNLYFNQILISLFQSSNISFLIDEIKKFSNIDELRSDLEYFRNQVFYNQYNNGIKEQNNSGYLLNQELKNEMKNLKLSKLPTYDEIKDRNKKSIELQKENFDLLFNNEKLLYSIKEVLKKNNLEEINFHQAVDVDHKWYKDHDHHGILNSTNFVLKLLTRSKDKSLNLEQIKDIISNPDNQLRFIKEYMELRKIKEFNSNEQKDFTKQNTVKLQEKLLTDGLTDLYYFDQKTKSAKYKSAKVNEVRTVYFFDNIINLDLSKDFYLDTLEFSEYIFPNKGESTFEFIQNKINDDEIFNSKVSEIINNSKLDDFALVNHIDYAIENKLKDTYERIKENILNSNSLSTRKDIFKEFIPLIDNQNEFLKKCTKDSNSYLCWQAVSVLKNKAEEEEFIINIARNYLKSGKTQYIINAIDILFFTNQNDAISQYLKFITSDNLHDSYYSSILEFSNYTNDNELEQIKEIFNWSYNGKGDFRGNIQNFLVEIIAQLSSIELIYPQINELLGNLKIEIEQSGKDPFYINRLIEISENSHINSMNQPLSFEEAKKIVEGN